ncbi:hypothetical protein ACFQ08_09590 [Streptosporangium algeriense]|uniref:Uncharacterized protein n=1 Tax=Streptosporangium algeriense TaxID=1682748 RepID=A0ABW3DP57_9ACTN
MSETAHEVGTALGTAVLGSILLGFHRTGLASQAPIGLPGDVLSAAEETLAAALAFAAELPGALGQALADAAVTSFTRALAWTGGLAALILTGVAIFAAIMLHGVSAQADLVKADHWSPAATHLGEKARPPSCRPVLLRAETRSRGTCERKATPSRPLLLY